MRISFLSVSLVLCSTLATLGCTAKREPEWRSLPEYALLLKAQRFTSDVDGECADTPLRVIALQMIWEQPWADAAFKDLLANATLPGQLFALCGLYYTDPETFRAQVEVYGRREEKVETQFGCIVDSEWVSELVKSCIVGDDFPKRFREAGIYKSQEPLKPAGYYVLQLEVEQDSNPEDATFALARLGREAVPELIKALTHKKERVRGAAADALSRIGPWAKDAVPALTAALDDPAAKVRLDAARALGEMAPWAGAAIPALKKTLWSRPSRKEEWERTEDDKAAKVALLTLNTFGEETTQAIVDAILHPDEVIAQTACLAVGGRQPAPKGAISVLIEALRTQSNSVRESVAFQLGEFGRAAAAAIPALQEAAKDSDENLAFNAAEALKKIENPEGN